MKKTTDMKTTVIAIAATAIAIAVQAQEATRTMRVFYEGNVVYTRDVTKVDSINFLLNEEEDGQGGEEQGDSSQIYAGVVAFNSEVNQLPITDDLDAVRMFISSQSNDRDFTAFAYSVSQGNRMFDAEGLPQFDKIFMLNFSDGTDNYSNRKWGDEGRMVSPANVYDTARYDLMQRAGLNSYAIGFGDDVGFGEKMRKVVTGGGSYHNAASSAQLQPTFNEIANSIIASSKNVMLRTNSGYYFEGSYKYFRFTFTADGSLHDTIYAKMEGNPTDGFTLNVTAPGRYAQFDSPARGTEDAETGKVLIPLNNLKFISGGEEVQFDFEVEVSFDGEMYYTDVEEASTAESISKRIAVVLVLDCSTSMGESFAPMQEAAIDFIETLEEADPSQGSNGMVLVDFTEELNGVKLNMIAVKGGRFVMGAQNVGAALPNYDPDAESNEQPTHNVTLSDFFIGETEVTQELWEYVMGAHNATHYPEGAERMYLYPAFNSAGRLVETGGTDMYGGNAPTSSYGDGENYPVYYVSYNDISGEHGFLDRLNALTGKKYRLPTEAEWEYAARGGQENQYTRETTDAAGAPSNAEYFVYSGSNTLEDVAWYYDYGYTKMPVKGKKPNDLGLYDMSGNVREWCADGYGSYTNEAQTDPTGSKYGNYGVLRGGSNSGEANCRVSARGDYNQSSRDLITGFRIALSR